MAKMDMMQGYNTEAFSVAVKKKRKYHGLTQCELADLIGCSTSTICRVEQDGTVNVLVFNGLLRWMGARAEDFDMPTPATFPDSRIKVFQRLETAMKLREECEANVNGMQYNHLLTKQRVIIELKEAGDYVCLEQKAELDQRSQNAYSVFLAALRELRHASDTVELVETEIRLWERGMQ